MWYDAGVDAPGTKEIPPATGQDWLARYVVNPKSSEQARDELTLHLCRLWASSDSYQLRDRALGVYYRLAHSSSDSRVAHKAYRAGLLLSLDLADEFTYTIGPLFSGCRSDKADRVYAEMFVKFIREPSLRSRIFANWQILLSRLKID